MSDKEIRGYKSVKFHEEGRTFFWVIATGAVFTADDRLMATDAKNLEDARKKVLRVLRVN